MAHEQEVVDAAFRSMMTRLIDVGYLSLGEGSDNAERFKRVVLDESNRCKRSVLRIFQQNGSTRDEAI